jgi:hypothetical protein
MAFKAIDRHYRSVEEALALRPGDTVPVVRNTVVVREGCAATRIVRDRAYTRDRRLMGTHGFDGNAIRL